MCLFPPVLASKLESSTRSTLRPVCGVRQAEKGAENRSNRLRREEGRGRESLQGFFFVRFLFDVPASCDACRTPSAANLLIGKCVGAKGVERASAGGELGEKKKEEEKGCCCCCFFFRHCVALSLCLFIHPFSPCRRLRCGKGALCGPAQGLSDGRSPTPEGAREAEALPSGGHHERKKKRGWFFFFWLRELSPPKKF